MSYIFPRITTLIITTTNECNLECVYCHNRPFLNSFFKKPIHLKYNDFEKICREYCNYLTLKGYPVGEFCFSGGEPLLLGPKYYEKFFTIQKKIFGRKKIKITNLFQTNGTLVDEKWIKFFKKYDVKIGISIDGTRDNQNKTRPFKNQGKTFQSINHTIFLLKRNNIRFGFLCVVSRYNMNNAKRIMDFFISSQPESIAFIPCLDYFGKIKDKEYGKFLVQSFNRWVELKRYDIPVRNFKFVLHALLGIKNLDLPCENAGRCPCNININLNGDMFICDIFMGKKEGYLGNIKEISLLEIEKMVHYLQVRKRILSLPAKCKKCKFLEICNGGCFYRRISRKNNLDYLCKANLEIFNHIANYLKSNSNLAKVIEKKIPSGLNSGT